VDFCKRLPRQIYPCITFLPILAACPTLHTPILTMLCNLYRAFLLQDPELLRGFLFINENLSARCYSHHVLLSEQTTFPSHTKQQVGNLVKTQYFWSWIIKNICWIYSDNFIMDLAFVFSAIPTRLSFVPFQIIYYLRLRFFCRFWFCVTFTYLVLSSYDLCLFYRSIFALFFDCITSSKKLISA
jgi:hypothetical protein